jgi:leucyl-tRNA synthetase
VEGAARFLKRLWDLAYRRKDHFNPDPDSGVAGWQFAEPDNWQWDGASAGQQERRRHIHALLKKANDDFSREQFNTVVSAAMQILNNLQVPFPPARDLSHPDGNEEDAEARLQFEGLGILLRMLYPITPHIAHYLWNELGYRKRFRKGGDVEILDAGWPQVDESALVQDTVTLVIQVNGKVRGRIDVPADAARADLENLVINEPNVRKHLQDRAVKRFILVPGKLVNVVA